MLRSYSRLYFNFGNLSVYGSPACSFQMVAKSCNCCIYEMSLTAMLKCKLFGAILKWDNSAWFVEHVSYILYWKDR